jgi:hypothetical protein
LAKPNIFYGLQQKPCPKSVFEQNLPTNKADGAWMMEHLAENFLAHFSDKELIELIWSLCLQSQQSTYFLTHFGDKGLMELIWRLCQQSQQSTFVMEGARRADMRIPVIADISTSKQN